MKSWLQQLISLVLPVTVLILIPMQVESHLVVGHPVAFFAGLLLMCIGLCVVFVTIRAFIRVGKGTLAPWSPTRTLVTGGLYGYVRNPMIEGVLLTLLGEAAAVESVTLLLWAGAFFIICNVYFVLYEEPSLRRRFGDQYLAYKQNVPRWIPRLKPFNPPSP